MCGTTSAQQLIHCEAVALNVRQLVSALAAVWSRAHAHTHGQENADPFNSGHKHIRCIGDHLALTHTAPGNSGGVSSDPVSTRVLFAILCRADL